MSGEGVNMKIRGRLYFKKMMTFIVGTTFLELHDKTALQRSTKHLKYMGNQNNSSIQLVRCNQCF